MNFTSKLCIFFFIICCNLISCAYACKDFLPADINYVKLIPTESNPHGAPVVTDIRTIVTFEEGFYDNCTLDCKCVYNTTHSTWEVQSSDPTQTCVFEKQCKQCKNSDKQCEIRFPTYHETLYKIFFFADQPNKKVMQKCSLAKNGQIECVDVSVTPTYSDIKPLNCTDNIESCIIHVSQPKP